MTKADKLSLVAYYLSKYDIKGVNYLGYTTRSEAMKDLSIRLGSNNSYIKRRRDEFDVLTGSHRRGQCNRKPAPAVLKYHENFKDIDFEEFSTKVIQLLKDV